MKNHSEGLKFHPERFFDGQILYKFSKFQYLSNINIVRTRDVKISLKIKMKVINLNLGSKFLYEQIFVNFENEALM